MKSHTREHWDRNSALLGALIWFALAGLAGAGRAPLGVIELLFLFAPLVIVPLGLALAGAIAPVSIPSLEDAARIAQPFAALLVVASFWFTPGPWTAALALPWALMCAALAASGVLNLLASRLRSVADFAAGVARADLAIAAAWLLVSRFGFRPLGFQEPIVLLTAVHFHFTGFGASILASAAAAFAAKIGRNNRLTSAIVILVALLPFLLAAGFVLSPAVKVFAATMLSLSVIALALWQLALAGRTANWTSRGYLALSSLSVMAGMTLAAVYAIGDWLGETWLTIPRMASTHGLLNGLGFVMLGMLGWLVEFRGQANTAKRVHSTASDSVARPNPGFGVENSLVRHRSRRSTHYAK